MEVRLLVAREKELGEGFRKQEHYSRRQAVLNKTKETKISSRQKGIMTIC